MSECYRNNRLYADLEGDYNRPEWPQFTREQMDRIPSDKLWYQLAGYDEDGYYQAGQLQGTEEYCLSQNWEIEGGCITRMISTYRHLYGDDFVNSVLAG